MKLFTASQIRAIDAATIEKEPIESISLMERAAMVLFDAFLERYDAGCRVMVFAGSGNNGGDALALARLLALLGSTFEVHVFIMASKHRSPDNEINLKRVSDLSTVEVATLTSYADFPIFRPDDIIVDGLLGTGLSRTVEGLQADLIAHINESKVEVFSVDIPSGLFAENNAQHAKFVVQANFTVSFQFPKLSFLLSDGQEALKSWEVCPIGLHPETIEMMFSPYSFFEEEEAMTLYMERSRFSHKGTFGHALLIAGKKGMMGAAILATKACLRSGVGLATIHLPNTSGDLLQITVPEALLSIDRSELMFADELDVDAYSAVGVGPGIGTKPNVQQALCHLLQTSDRPLVLDADALNILSLNKEWFSFLPKNTVITPHPGEFDRLTHVHHSAYDRLMTQIELAKKWHLVIVLKGAFSSVVAPDGSCSFNSTGNHGMATAGCGDVLTGIITGLLAQGYFPLAAAKLGVWWHGKAADLFAQENGAQSLIASDIIDYMPKVDWTI